METIPYFVYRCYDKGRQLLYVGCSRDVGKRMRHHRYQSVWHPEMVYTTVEMVSGMEAAYAREREVIAAEKPLHNITHSTRGERPKGSAELRAALDGARSYDGFLGIVEAAERYNLRVSTIRLHVRKGILPAFLLGGSWVTTIEEMQHYMESHKGRRGRPPKGRADA